MIISIWRYSHLALAVSSFIFILIASLTGIILAFEPISNQLKPYAIKEANKQTVAKTIDILNNNYNEVLEIRVDNNGFVIADVIEKNGNSSTFYVNPLTGKKLGSIIEKAPIFKFSANLHRSLFLKSMGRFFVALTSFLLFLIAVTGVILIIKRQGSFKKFFSKIIKEDFYQFYHIIFGRLSLIPIIIITLTGVYLSLEKFDLLPKDTSQHTINLKELKENSKNKTVDFEVFKSTTLGKIRRIEFPFSTDVEDYYTLELKDKEILVNQITGKVISERVYPFTKIASYYSMILHTGQGSILWSIVLLMSTCAILFFIYSGFSMTLSRMKKSTTAKNKFAKDEAEYIVLVGSETGNTYRFANAFYDAMTEADKKVYITQLNNFSDFKEVKHVIVFTSTYGVGEAPANAKKFTEAIEKHPLKNQCYFSVVGFGSLAYPDFCQFAIDIDEMLQKHPAFNQFLTVEKINNQSFDAFKNWAHKWSQKEQLILAVKPPKQKEIKTSAFTVVERTALNNDQTFTIRLKPEQKIKFQSGDLVSFYPKKDNIERQYSIGRLANDILLSIKKHEFGVCSTYLSKLGNNDKVNAVIKQNKNFHFPKQAKQIIFIANGTGIAPFLGMLSENTTKCKVHLFWGGSTKNSFELYKDIIDSSLQRCQLSNINIAFSQENKEKVYVQDLLLKEQEFIAKSLQEGAIIMICGSIAMQKDVIEVLDHIAANQINKSLNDFKKLGQIKTDCY